MSSLRALQRLAKGAILAPIRNGSEYGVLPQADRRRRPVARLSRKAVRTLAAEGAIAARADGETYELTPAGQARLQRESASPDEAFLAQHRQIGDRHVIDASGAIRPVRGCDPHHGLKRLATIRDNDGRCWFSAAELQAAEQLRADWLSGEVGALRGSDWTAAPQSRGARGPGNAAESAMIRSCEARARASAALASLAPPLRRAVEIVCLQDAGFETLERSQGWPARSGKLALKMALAQLSQRRG
jgi:hypothetical protein